MPKEESTADGHSFDDVIVVQRVVHQLLDSIRQIVERLGDVAKEAHRRDELEDLLVVVALLDVVLLQLGVEDGHQLLLLLDMESIEGQLHFLQVAHDDHQELQGRIHCQFAEHDRL